MIPLPWTYVASWNCIACGNCCKGYDVILSFPEWVNMIRTYGVGVTEPGINKFYLKRRIDGSCIFLHKIYDLWLCRLHMKPKACKIWPFKILNRPKFGSPNHASYEYGGRNFFIYIDSTCVGIRWGKPTQEFTYKTVREFVEIALGLREKQLYTTANLSRQLPLITIKTKKSRTKLI